MPRFDFQSPGAAATGAIQQFLLQQEVQRRQQEQDALAQDREERLRQHEAQQMQLGQAQLDSIDDQRKQTIADRQAAQAEGVAKTIVGSKRAGDKYSPEDAATLRKTPGYAGYVEHRDTAQGAFKGNDEGGVPQYAVNEGGDFATGTPAERQKLEAKGAVDEIFKAHPDLRSNPAVDADYKLAMATGNYEGLHNSLMKMMEPAPRDLWITRTGQMMLMSPDGKPQPLPKGFVPSKDDRVHNEPAPPSTYDRSKLSAVSEGAMIDRLQKGWDKAQSANVTMQRQYELMKTGLDRFEAGDANGGSQAVLVTFQKILDPLSVVRESEYARSPQGLGALSRMEGYMQRLVGGGAGVPAADLKQMVETARQFTENVKHSTAGVRKRTGLTADRFQIPHELVFTDEPVDDGGGKGGDGLDDLFSEYEKQGRRP